MSVVELERREVRRLGEYETVWHEPDFYLSLPQIRDTRNPILDDLKDSIRDGDLLNPIDVAILDEFSLLEYLDFINHTWKTNVQLADCLDKRQPDGTFFLVIAGHTRHQAVSELNVESDAPLYELPAKIHRITDPSEIIDIQVRENLHSVPRQEQAAIAFVEQYLWGLQAGQWKSKAEYIKQKQGQISHRQLNEALLFADLSDEIKQYVFTRELAYSVALEVGRAHETVAEHTLMKMGGVLDTPDLVQDFKITVNRKIISMINHMNGKTMANKKKLNVTAAKQHIKGRMNAMQQEILASRNEDEGVLFDLEMITADQQAAMYVSAIEKEFKEMLRYVEQLSIDSTDQTLALARRAERSGVALEDDLIDRLEEERTQRQRHFGRLGLVGAAV